MEVILLERIAKLGQMGEVVNVKPGFARNYLLPQKKALRATDTNRQKFEQRRSQLEAQNLERKSEAETVAKKLDGISVVLVRQAGEAGQLYGSVSARDIAVAVTEAGFTVERRQIDLNQPIKSIGLVQMEIALHPEVHATITVNVARSPEEAEIQAKTGAAVILGQAADAEDAAEEAKRVAAALFEEGAGPKEEGEEAAEGETEDKAEPKAE